MEKAPKDSQRAEAEKKARYERNEGESSRLKMSGPEKRSARSVKGNAYLPVGWYSISRRDTRARRRGADQRQPRRAAGFNVFSRVLIKRQAPKRGAGRLGEGGGAGIRYQWKQRRTFVLSNCRLTGSLDRQKLFRAFRLAGLGFASLVSASGAPKIQISRRPCEARDARDGAD